MEAAVNFRWDNPDNGSESDGNCKMVFCIARIDNHQELARQFSLDPGISVSELIIHLYRSCGTDCAKQFLGDFAFAIWDPKKRHIYAARDFMGCQPVYYWRDGQAMMIADNIESILVWFPHYLDHFRLGWNYAHLENLDDDKYYKSSKEDKCGSGGSVDMGDVNEY